MLIRNLAFGVSILGSGLLVLNRVVSANPTPEQTRSDALGLLLAAILALVGILSQQIQSVPGETVAIEARQGTLVAQLPPERARELVRLGESLLANTGAVSVLIWDRGQTLLRMGYYVETEFKLGPIVERVLKTQKPVYLVSLKLFPGRVEFSYLPEGMQAVVCQPLGRTGVLVLGANRIRAFTPEALRWIETLAQWLLDFYL